MNFSLILYLLGIVAFFALPALAAGVVAHNLNATANFHPTAVFLVFLGLTALFSALWAAMAYLAAKSWHTLHRN